MTSLAAVNVTFNIVKGEKVRIERIDIVGNERTRDKVIRRELRLYEGEYYSTTGLERSQRLINRLGYFEPGSVRIQTRRGSSPNTMHLVIEVKEKPTGSFQVGAGFSTVENFVGQLKSLRTTYLVVGRPSFQVTSHQEVSQTFVSMSPICRHRRKLD